MSDTVQKLRDFKPEHDFLIAIDSDGCVFDTMELKQKECFIPNSVLHWSLQPISKYARQASEFVNLYSQSRGVNRFPAMLQVFDLLEDWDEVQARGTAIPKTPNLRRWVETESKLGNPALIEHCRNHPDEEDMQTALRWSEAVNDTVAKILGSGVPPFPYVRESLEKANAKADVMVCSATPSRALEDEWKGQNLTDHVFCICGQEAGKKAEHIALASEGRFEGKQTLMVGDAPGDLKAARSNNAYFFPILPGQEEVSWRRFYEEGLDHFFNGSFGGAYEEELIAEFNAVLPSTPPWKQK